MEPDGRVFELADGSYRGVLNTLLPEGTLLYSAEKLATLQAKLDSAKSAEEFATRMYVAAASRGLKMQTKLEQAEKSVAELVEVMRRVVYLSDRNHDAWDAAKKLIAKHEVKKL